MQVLVGKRPSREPHIDSHTGHFEMTGDSSGWNVTIYAEQAKFDAQFFGVSFLDLIYKFNTVAKHGGP
jgi:hypothetical protein